MTDALGSRDALERRLRAVAAVGDVVGAIWALARAQLATVEAGAGEASAYLSAIDAAIDRLAGPEQTAPESEQLTVVIGPERPFCGSLSREVLRHAPGKGALGLVGRRFIEAAEARSIDVERVRFSLSGASSIDDLSRVVVTVASAVLTHSGGARVGIVYPDTHLRAIRHVVLLSGVRRLAHRLPETFSPPGEVLAAAVRESVTARLHVALVETLRAEVQHRVAAAEVARQAVDKKQSELEQSLHIMRQEQITGELLELHAARSALAGGHRAA